VGVIAFFASRDKGGTSTNGVATGAVDRSAADVLLRAGNVEFFYASEADGGRLRALADQLGAADTAALRAAGQAVVLRRRSTENGVLVRAWHHSLHAASAADPRLQDFVETWLGAVTSP
jgi:hypothetical protein